MKLTYVVFSCDKYKDRLDAIKETWGSSRELIVLGDELAPGKGYESCPYKYVEFFRTFEPAHDWYVFVDDDTYVNTEVFERWLNEQDATGVAAHGLFKLYHYGLHPELISGAHTLRKQLTFPVGGAGFALSLGAVKVLKEYVIAHKSLPLAYNSDTTMGIWMTEARINGTYNDRFVRHANKLGNVVAGNTFTCHQITPQHMRDLHNDVLKGRARRCTHD
jgi:hypothetical protein